MKKSLIPGVNPYLSNEEYHADKEYLSSSKLKTLLESAEKFKKELDTPPPPMTGSHLDLGTYVHSLILEPELVSAEYITFPGFRRAGKDYEKFKLLHTDKNIISLSMEHNGKRMLASVKACQPALKLLEKGQPEVSITTIIDGVPLKIRADWLNIEDGYAIDVKTTRNPVDRSNFKQTIKDYQYDLSAALYIAVLENHFKRPFDWYWLPISKEEPPETKIYKASKETLSAGMIKVYIALEKYKKCKETGIWLDTVAEKKEKEIQNEIEEI